MFCAIFPNIKIPDVCCGVIWYVIWRTPKIVGFWYSRPIYLSYDLWFGIHRPDSLCGGESCLFLYLFNKCMSVKCFGRRWETIHNGSLMTLLSFELYSFLVSFNIIHWLYTILILAKKQNPFSVLNGLLTIL